jgi:hypothetical protein
MSQGQGRGRVKPPPPGLVLLLWLFGAFVVLSNLMRMKGCY